jgi:hypothetical protein
MRLSDGQWILFAHRFYGEHKLMSAMTYLDEQQHRTLKLDDYPAIGVMYDLLSPRIAEIFSLDRASRWQLPVGAIEWLDAQNGRLTSQLSSLRERGEHE